jgi:16S rRNA (cytosine967-C5)-methyltransferase
VTASASVSPSVSPARAVAFAVVRRVFERGAYADRAFVAEAIGLAPRERAFAMQLAYGTVQRRATLDHFAERLSGRTASQIDPELLAALRLGLFQLVFLDGVAEHAAVNESVELAKLGRGQGFRFVNAVLRRAARESGAMLAKLDDSSPAAAALRYSVPEWLADRWWDELGADATRAQLARINDPAESALRVNTLVTTAAEAAAELRVPSHPVPDLPEALILDAPFDAHGSELWRGGAIMPQSRASMLVARTLNPLPGQRVLDLCAAPGAKTTHLAALMDGSGELVAVERHAGRAGSLSDTCARMGAHWVRVKIGDAATFRLERPFDRVLVDPPCSGLGTLQSRPDLRWRASPEKIDELAAVQRRILQAGAAATAPGGALVYSVCTISRAESVEVVGGFLAANPDFKAEVLGSDRPPWRHPGTASHLQLLPARDRTDGFFIARLKRD